jgi:hypothetical protein
MRRSKYAASQVEDIIIVIDLGGTVSVTNDAERVVEELAEHFDLTMCRIVYRDTEGRYDGLALKGGSFAGFVHLGVFTEEEALKLADSRPHWNAGHGVLDHAD